MNHAVFYFSLVAIFLSMAVVILNNQEKMPSKLISVLRYYSYIDSDNNEMEVVLYLNDLKHPIVDVTSYENTYLTNRDETKKIETFINKIAIGHTEYYLGETYTQIILSLGLPYLNQDYLIEEALLNIELLNGDEYSIEIGEFSLMRDHNYISNLEWSGLKGLKNENQFTARLSKIFVDYFLLNKPILEIYIGVDFLVNFSVEENQLILQIPCEDMLLLRVPIRIIYENGEIETIPSFRYLIDYQILKESGFLIRTYVLD